MAAHEGGDRVAVSIVVPVFNAARTLPELDERIAAGVADAGLGPIEVVYVDDASVDGSAAVLADVAARRPTARVVTMATNRGQAGAILAGIAASSGEVIVTLDDDLGHPPEAIPTLVAALDAEADIVYAALGRHPRGMVRRMSAAAVRAVLGLSMGLRMGMAVSPFRAFRRSVLVDADLDAPTSSVDLLLARGSRRFRSVPVPTAGEGASRLASRYTVPTLLALAGHMARSSIRLRLERTTAARSDRRAPEGRASGAAAAAPHDRTRVG
jgi:glycosyltransferase involved in cell wall biosynthesis